MSVAFQWVYLAAILISLALNLYIIYLCDKQRNQFVTRHLSYIVLLSSGVIIAWFGTSLAPTSEVAFFWTRFRLFVISLMPVVALTLVLYMLKWRQWLTFPRYSLLWIIPAGNLFFTLFQPNNPLFIEEWSWATHDLLGIEMVQLGAWQRLSGVYYFLIVCLAVWMALYHRRIMSRLLNLQVAWILGGISMVWVLSSLGVWRMIPAEFPSPYPLAAVFGGVMVAYGLRLSPFRDVGPIAHELVFRDMSQAVLVLSANDLIVDMNKAGQNLLGAGDALITDRPIDHYPEIARVVRDGESIPETRLKDRFYSVNVSHVQRPNGQSLGRVVVLTDITERKRHEEERERLVNALDAYAHTVAHDLKNPVAIVTGYLDLVEMVMESEPDNIEEIKIFIEKARMGTNTMRDIIQSMLLLATLRQNEGVSLVQVNMGRVVDQVLERLAFDIENADADIHIEGVLPSAYGHHNWVEEVWLNYLSNALKYGGKPPIIYISATPDTQHGFVRYNVRDNGTGMSEDEQYYLFQKMKRLERHSELEGHGLGLTIVRQMVERMGGKVMVKSQPGEGSTFSFTLPTN